MLVGGRTLAVPGVVGHDDERVRAGAHLVAGERGKEVLVADEDLFPQLAVDEVRSGADALVVVTNDAWYGEGAAAYQHAASSVLRAVETRRPVLRCGNAGWSGWIDEFGNIRRVATDESGSIYFRGTRLARVTRDQRWVGRNSFYVEHGDWFVLACACLAALSVSMLGISGLPPAKVDAQQ